MDSHSFFETIENHYAKQLPFVVYRRPINSVIKCWLQNNNAINTTSNFEESGFVFAPFNLKDNTILFNSENCSYSEFQFEAKEEDEAEVEDGKNSISTKNSKLKASHISFVEKGIEAIKNNTLKKVVLSRVCEQSASENQPITLFKKLLNTYKNAMVYCWYHPKVGLWLGATPELLFKTQAQQLTAISLAGTKPFEANSLPNFTAKEHEEQQIVTNFLANQLQPYALSTQISDVNTIRAGNLWHLKTKLISQLKPEICLKSIIQALHPTPAVCGFPKQTAMDFILKHENYNREYYTGFLGELNLKQTKSRNTNSKNVENNAYKSVKTQSNFYVNLRCMQLKTNTALIYIGGGITKNSNAEQEWQETVNKAKTMLNILG